MPAQCMPLSATPVPSLRPAVLSHCVSEAQTTRGVHSLLFWHCIALHCAVRERAEPHVHWASLRRQISMNCLISETSAGILAAVDGRVVKNLKVRWKFAKGRGGQIVVVSLRNARAAKGRCRVRIRRGMAEREVGRLWRGKPRQLQGCDTRAGAWTATQHSTQRGVACEICLYTHSPALATLSAHLTSLDAKPCDFSTHTV